MTKRADEFIFEFQKIKHAHKVLEILIGKPDKRAIMPDAKNSAVIVDVDNVNEKEQLVMCKFVNNHLLTNVEYY